MGGQERKIVRRQHVVSRFYLNGFATTGGRVRRVRLPGDDNRELSTKDVAVLRDFYTIELPDGTKSDVFEKLFSEIESVAAPALQAVLAGTWPLQGEQRMALAGWIALQHLRTQDVRAGQETAYGELIRLIVGSSGKKALKRHIESAEGAVISDARLNAEWGDLTKPGGPNLKADVAQHVRTILDLMPGFAAYLADSHWTVYRFAKKSIVTSDHPVSLVAPEDDPTWGGAVGLATAEMFLIPLARRTALVIQPRRRFDDLRPSDMDPASIPDFEHSGTAKIALSLNWETVRHSKEYLYHHPEDSPLDPFDLPEPLKGSGLRVDGVEGLIREEGLYADSGPGKAPPSPEPRGDDGLTINDIPWPLPGRTWQYDSADKSFCPEQPMAKQSGDAV